jgi:hypothetical protein
VLDGVGRGVDEIHGIRADRDHGKGTMIGRKSQAVHQQLAAIERTDRRLDVVALNGGSFVALKDKPGPCPGSGWQLIASQGKRGVAGEKGERGPPGPRGDAGASSSATIRDWKIDRARYLATPIMSDGSDGPQLELRGLFEQFFSEVQG